MMVAAVATVGSVRAERAPFARELTLVERCAAKAFAAPPQCG